MSDDTRSTIRAIETRYAGCHFRSRLEARWAVFFDTLGIEWEYEPQGFEWSAGAETVASSFLRPEDIKGGRYLPDFWLPSIATWFEVKGGTTYDDQDSRIHTEFSAVIGQRHITALGDMPVGDPADPKIEIGGTEFMYLNGGCDFYYRWCLCPWCGKPDIQFDGRGGRVCPGDHDCVGPCIGDGCQVEAIHHYTGRPSDKAYTNDDPKILAAYSAARSARFEWGQSGAT